MDWDDIALKPVAFDKQASDSDDYFEVIQPSASALDHFTDKGPEKTAAVNLEMDEEPIFDGVRDLVKDTQFLSSIFNKIFEVELIEKLLRELPTFD